MMARSTPPKIRGAMFLPLPIVSCSAIPSPTVTSEDFASFILYRQLINPDETFESLLGQEDLEDRLPILLRQPVWRRQLRLRKHLRVQSLLRGSNIPKNEVTRTERVLLVDSGGSESVEDFRIKGSGIVADGDSRH